MDTEYIMALATALISPVVGAFAASSLTRWRVEQSEKALEKTARDVQELERYLREELARLRLEHQRLASSLEFLEKRMGTLESAPGADDGSGAAQAQPPS